MSSSYILITGAGGGLGKAFVTECASRGWNLFLTDRSKKTLDSIARTNRSVHGIKVKTYKCNLADENERQKFCDYILTSEIVFSGLINIAGLDHEGLFRSKSLNDIREIMSVNVMSVLEITNAVLSSGAACPGYLQINVCSLAGFYPMPLKAVYAASKRFLLDFTLALREELSGCGARITALCPAGLPTHTEVMKSIDSQGFMGKLTTWNIGDVAHLTVSAAIKNKPVVIPGMINRVLKIMGQIVPKALVTRLVKLRWQKTRAAKASANTAI